MLQAVKLLGQLFASPHADYCTEFHRNFRDFLGRFNDLSAAVRIEMVDRCVPLTGPATHSTILAAGYSRQGNLLPPTFSPRPCAAAR